jgi:hypothetical protein
MKLHLIIQFIGQLWLSGFTTGYLHLSRNSVHREHVTAQRSSVATETVLLERHVPSADCFLWGDMFTARQPEPRACPYTVFACETTRLSWNWAVRYLRMLWIRSRGQPIRGSIETWGLVGGVTSRRKKRYTETKTCTHCLERKRQPARPRCRWEKN